MENRQMEEELKILFGSEEDRELMEFLSTGKETQAIAGRTKVPDAGEAEGADRPEGISEAGSAGGGDGSPSDDISAMLDELLAESDPSPQGEEESGVQEAGSQDIAGTFAETEQSRERMKMEINETTAVIPAGMTITGNVTLKSDIWIYGTVDGDIHCGGSVMLMGGRIEGDVEADIVKMQSGSMKGDVSAAGDVVMEAGTELEGNVTAGNFRSDAKNVGDVKVCGGVDIRRNAVVVGNITAASFSVVAGAKIRGMVTVEEPVPEASEMQDTDK